MKKLIITLLLIAATVSFAYAHSGGTDRLGCHVDSKTGIRHWPLKLKFRTVLRKNITTSCFVVNLT